MTSPTIKGPTICFIGVAAYLSADIIHEAIGHGGTCLLLGNRITLLTSVYFKSTPGSPVTDIGGPLANLLFGLLIHFFLKRQQNLSLPATFLLLNIMSYNLFWFSGTILQSGFSRVGDWTYAIKELNIGAFSRPVLLTAGIIAYLLSIKIIAPHFDRIRSAFPAFRLRQGISYAYFSAAVTAIIAGLFYKNARLHAALEGLLEIAGSLPILFIGAGRRSAVDPDKP